MRQLILIYTKIAIKIKGIIYFLISSLDGTNSNPGKLDGGAFNLDTRKNLPNVRKSSSWSLLTVRRDWGFLS